MFDVVLLLIGSTGDRIQRLKAGKKKAKKGKLDEMDDAEVKEVCITHHNSTHPPSHRRLALTSLTADIMCHVCRTTRTMTTSRWKINCPRRRITGKTIMGIITSRVVRGMIWMMMVVAVRLILSGFNIEGLEIGILTPDDDFGGIICIGGDDI